MAWNLPVSVIVSGCDLPTHVEENVKTAQTYKKLSETEKQKIVSGTATFKGPEVEYYKKKV